MRRKEGIERGEDEGGRSGVEDVRRKRGRSGRRVLRRREVCVERGEVNGGRSGWREVRRNEEGQGG